MVTRDQSEASIISIDQSEAMCGDQGPIGARAGCLAPPPHRGRSFSQSEGSGQSVANTRDCIIIIIKGAIYTLKFIKESIDFMFSLA